MCQDKDQREQRDQRDEIGLDEEEQREFDQGELDQKELDQKESAQGQAQSEPAEGQGEREPDEEQVDKKQGEGKQAERKQDERKQTEKKQGMRQLTAVAAAKKDAEEPKPGNNKTKSLKVLLEAIMLCIFAFIVLMTDFLGSKFGEAAGNVALVICALILAALLFWPSKKR